MSPPIQLMLADIREEALADFLRAAGWHCERVSDYEWETPKRFDGRHGLRVNWLARQRFHKAALPAFEGVYGKKVDKKSARLIRLRSNPELEAYVESRKTN